MIRTRIQAAIGQIRTELHETFGALDEWFTRPEGLRAHKPIRGGWSINQILEHITLTNHFLLLLIEKGRRKALQEAAKERLPAKLDTYQLTSEALEQIGQPGTFAWVRPEHMEPQGVKTTAEVRELLRSQLDHCLRVLDELPNGEGTLYQTTMTVNQLGKLDVYQYLCFLVQHANRHLTQMQKVADEYAQSNRSIRY